MTNVRSYNIVLSKHINKWYTSDLHIGLKGIHLMIQCTFVLQEITDLFFHNNISLFIILLDASQTFDGVDYCKMFDLLINS